MKNVRLGPLLLLLFVTLGTQAQQPFRAALSGRDTRGCSIIPISFRHLEWFPTRVEFATNVAYIAADGNDRVFGLLLGPPASGLRIVRVQPDGTQTPFYQDLDAIALSFAVTRDGRVYVPLRTGGSFFLAVISPAGVLEATHPLPITEHPYSTAVAYDGCTVFFTDFGSTTISRFNACTGTPLSNLVVAAPVQDVEPLANGQILLAQNQNANLYDANGVFIRTAASLPTYGYFVHGEEFIGQLAVDSSMADLWLTVSGCDITGELLRVQFNSGSEMSRADISLNEPNALVLSSVNAATSDVPLSPNALLLLAVALAAVAVLRL